MQLLRWLKSHITWRGMYWTVCGSLLIAFTALTVVDMHTITGYSVCGYITYPARGTTIAACAHYIDWPATIEYVRSNTLAPANWGAIFFGIYKLIGVRSRTQGFVTRKIGIDGEMKLILILATPYAVFYTVSRTLVAKAQHFTVERCTPDEFHYCGQVWNWDAFIGAWLLPFGYVVLTLMCIPTIYEIVQLIRSRPKVRPFTYRELQRIKLSR